MLLEVSNVLHEMFEMCLASGFCAQPFVAAILTFFLFLSKKKIEKSVFFPSDFF